MFPPYNTCLVFLIIVVNVKSLTTNVRHDVEDINAVRCNIVLFVDDCIGNDSGLKVP